MNVKVREMIKDALESDGVEEIFKIGDEAKTEQDIFEQAENFKKEPGKCITKKSSGRKKARC